MSHNLCVNKDLGVTIKDTRLYDILNTVPDAGSSP